MRYFFCAQIYYFSKEYKSLNTQLSDKRNKLLKEDFNISRSENDAFNKNIS